MAALFSEFQIQLHGGAKHLRGLFNDQRFPVVIECKFQLRDREKSYINVHAAELLEETIWQTVLPEAFQYGGYNKALFAAQFRDKQPEVTAKVGELLPILMRELALIDCFGRVEISSSGQVNTFLSHVLSVVFANYRPRQIGVIDFHGAQRHYGRENVQGINLSLDQMEQARSHTVALMN